MVNSNFKKRLSNLEKEMQVADTQVHLCNIFNELFVIICNELDAWEKLQEGYRKKNLPRDSKMYKISMQEITDLCKLKTRILEVIENTLPVALEQHQVYKSNGMEIPDLVIDSRVYEYVKIEKDG